jgi:hypothetical protein
MEQGGKVKRMSQYVYTAGMISWIALLALLAFIGGWKIWERFN